VNGRAITLARRLPARTRRPHDGRERWRADIRAQRRGHDHDAVPPQRDEPAVHISGLVEVGTDLGAVLGQVVTAILSMAAPWPTMSRWLCVWF